MMYGFATVPSVAKAGKRILADLGDVLLRSSSTRTNLPLTFRALTFRDDTSRNKLGQLLTV